MSFAAVHITVASNIAFLMSGSVLVGGAIALVEPAVNTVACHFHDKLWSRVQAARRATPGQLAQEMQC